MKKYQFYLYLALAILVLSLSLSACRKFVQLDPPNTKLATVSVFTSDLAATAAQVTIYQNMNQQSESFKISQFGGLLADELKNYSTNVSLVQYYTNSMVSSNALLGNWSSTSAYFYIYQANSIVESLHGNAQITPTVARQLTGESLFVRAFWHFYLTNEYGDVPLVTSTNYQVNNQSGRTPQAQVYQQIIIDLAAAQGLLNGNYIDASDTTVTTERTRPNQSAATALLARVYLYTKQYPQAEAEATAVINNTLYKLCPNLSGPANSVFLKNSSEAIWQLQPTLPANSNTKEAPSFILKGAPGTGTVNSATISTQLYNSFEPGDKRQTNWINVYTATKAPFTQYYYPYKYQSNNVSVTDLSTATEYSMVLRLAEQYLIRAEARAYNGNTAGALDDLNKIRNRAGLSNYAGATDQASILTAILHERQVELFTEWGHRWFDLNRTGNITTVMGLPGNAYAAKGGIGAWSDTKRLFPVAQAQINADPNLVQNPGY
ncbi:RagB/SusD family nutrient uptake outer membrane protein [Mucilaginibacter ximonensis]|uniref:RagB/SusD family nutrient uptake outer membrane protein n=1 Tax=Mucilaginibacter ximonensis TaxID=538021 RepID=A0ABW5Y979_9SPHI